MSLHLKHMEVQLQGSAAQCAGSQKICISHGHHENTLLGDLANSWSLHYKYHDWMPYHKFFSVLQEQRFVAEKKEGSLKFLDVFLASEDGCVCSIAFMNLIEAEDRYNSQYGAAT